MNRYKKLFSNTVILAFGTFGSKLLVFLLMPLYTYLLSPAEYGTAELISGTANLIMPLACVGITNGIFRFAAERGSDREKVFSSGLALTFIGLCATLLIGIPVAIFSSYRTETWLILLYILSADMQAVCAQYVRAIDRTRLFALQGILNTMFTISLNLLFLMVFKMGVTGYVLSVIVGNLLTILFLTLTAKLWRVFSFRKVDKTTVSELLRFSLPMIPTTICWLITDLSDRYLVTWFRGEAENGIYSAAYKIPSIVNLTSGIFMQAWQFSAVSEMEDEKACRRFYSEVFRGFLSIVFIGSGMLILLSRVFTRLLLNATYHEAWRYMPTLLCAAALESVVSFLATVYMVRKKTLHSFFTAMTGTILNIILNILLIPDYGALGAAIATLIGYGAVLLLRLWDAPRYIGFTRCIPRQTVSIVLLLGAAGVMTFDVPHRLLWCGALVAAIFAINAVALWKGIQSLLRFRNQKGEIEEKIK